MKIKWPKISLPKVSLPKIGAPKFRLPKIALPQLALNRRAIVIGASALALLAAGGSGWFFVRPMLSGDLKLAGEAAQAEGDKHADAAPTPPKQQTRIAQQETKPPEKQDLRPEPLAGDSVAAPQNPGGKGAKAVALPPLAPPASAGEPEQLVRRLQDIQEKVAVGDAAAFAEMPRLLRKIAQKFVEQPPEVWSQKQNAQALILYLLSGGGSATGRKILSKHNFAPSEEPLARGAIAYLENVEGADRDYLLRLDPRTLDLELAAQVAFVQSILLSGSDRPRAIARLDFARLLAPGGLLEEAALRREIALLSETAEFDKFAGLARQYWQRYRASPFADNFLRQFMLAVVRVSQSIKLSEWAQLSEFIDSLQPETRRTLYLAMARSAAIVGNGGLAAMAAQHALDLSAVDSPDRQRALLYRAAAKVGVADFAQSRLLLRDLDRSKLPAADQPLYDAVTMALTRIYAPPEQHFEALPPGAANEVDASLARAQISLNRGEAALDSIRRTMERKSR